MSFPDSAKTASTAASVHSRKALVDRILNSRHFAGAELSRKLLAHVWEKTTDPDSPSLKEQELATRILGRPSEFDPKTDPVVRVNIAHVRDRLNRYFENEGRDETLRLVIPRGQYRAVFVEADAAFRDLSVESGNLSLQRLWQPYLTQRVQSRLLFTDLLFFTNDRGSFIRDVNINHPEPAAGLLRKKFPGLDTTEYRPAFPYVSAGEVRCLVRLLSMFSSLGVSVEASGTRFSFWNALKDFHLILLGSARTNRFLDSLQGRCPFLIGDDHIENSQPKTGEKRFYRRSPDKRGHMDRLTDFALFTRIPSMREGRVISMVAANHAKATEGAGEFLTSENEVRQLLEYMGLDEAAELPSFFQVLLRIDIVDQGQEVVQAVPIAFRIVED